MARCGGDERLAVRGSRRLGAVGASLARGRGGLQQAGRQLLATLRLGQRQRLGLQCLLQRRIRRCRLPSTLADPDLFHKIPPPLLPVCLLLR